MDSSSVKKKLKKGISETLTATLSPWKEFREAAENRLKLLGRTDDFGVHLTELILDHKESLSIRQLAAVVLRQYVKSHWCQYEKGYEAPETKPEAKAAIRELLLAGLKEPERKLRSSVAYAIAAIAQTDWPETWTNLFEILMSNLQIENGDLVHGTMRTLAEFTRHINDNQMAMLAPMILPSMLKIFLGCEKYSIRTRGRAVEIFATCVKSISESGQYDDDSMNNFPILPDFTRALVESLKLPDWQYSDNGLKKDVINALKMMIRCGNNHDWLPDALKFMLTSLEIGYHEFTISVVNCIQESSDHVDSDGEVLGFENQVVGIIDFITSLVKSSKYKNHLQQHAPDLAKFLILYMQMTAEQIRVWNKDVERFLECEEDNRSAFSVRISALDLLKLIATEFKEETTTGLCAAVTLYIQKVDKKPINIHWWKVHEACMVALESVHDCVTDLIKENKLNFDITEFLRSVVLADMSTTASPFLLGRCLSAGSCFMAFMPDYAIQMFLQATITGLQQSQHPCIRVCATRTTYRLCIHFKSVGNPEILLPHLPPLFEGLHVFAKQSTSGLLNTDLLSLVLRSLSMVVSVNESFAKSIEQHLISLAQEVLLKQSCEGVVIGHVQEIFKRLCGYPSCVATLHDTILPFLMSIIKGETHQRILGLQAAALDVLQTLVNHSPRPLPEGMITQMFPATVHCILHAGDNSVLQNGIECLRLYILNAFDQIKSYQDENGLNGLQYIYNVIEIILNPNSADGIAAYARDIITALIDRNSLSEISGKLFNEILCKIQLTKSLADTQSLLMVFCQLFYTDMENVLNFLSGVNISGKTGLDFILTKWCSCHNIVMNVEDNKVSTFLLSKILQYCIENDDARIRDIQIQNSEILPDSAMRTRFSVLSNQDSLKTVPLIVKIHKILIEELFSLYQTEQDSKNKDDKDKEEKDHSQKDQLRGYVNSMHLGMYLVEYLKKMSEVPYYESFTNLLTPIEKNILSNFGIPC